MLPCLQPSSQAMVGLKLWFQVNFPITAKWTPNKQLCFSKSVHRLRKAELLIRRPPRGNGKINFLPFLGFFHSTWSNLKSSKKFYTCRLGSKEHQNGQTVPLEQNKPFALEFFALYNVLDFLSQRVPLLVLWWLMFSIRSFVWVRRVHAYAFLPCVFGNHLRSGIGARSRVCSLTFNRGVNPRGYRLPSLIRLFLSWSQPIPPVIKQWQRP